LLYTNNIDIAIYHTQKSILYYIEFVGQIGEDRRNLLKLNTQDATLFIYKKTIFEVNTQYRSKFVESEDTKRKLELLDLYTNIYNNMVIGLIDNYECITDSMNDIQKILFTKIYKIVEILIQIPLVCYHTNNDFKMRLTNIKDMVSIVMNNNRHDFIRKNIWYLLSSMIKLCIRKNTNTDFLKQKLIEDDIDTKLKHMSVLKIVNYLCLSTTT